MPDLKASPGPWNEDGPIIYTGINQRTGKIAEVSLAYKDSATYSANLHLIAAAPELYEALATCLEARKLIGEGDYEKLPDFGEWEERALVALAKARGEQSS